MNSEGTHTAVFVRYGDLRGKVKDTNTVILIKRVHT